MGGLLADSNSTRDAREKISHRKKKTVGGRCWRRRSIKDDANRLQLSRFPAIGNGGTKEENQDAGQKAWKVGTEEGVASNSNCQRGERQDRKEFFWKTRRSPNVVDAQRDSSVGGE